MRKRPNAILLALIVTAMSAPALVAASPQGPQSARSQTRTIPGQLLPIAADARMSESYARTRLAYERGVVGTRVTVGNLTRSDGYLPPAEKGAAVQIGIHRDVPSPWASRMRGSALDWVRVGGGMVASLSVDSPGAEATRLAVQVLRMPAGAELRFFEPEDPRVVWGPYDRRTLLEPLTAREDRGDKGPARQRRSKDDLRAYWSPVMRGDRVGVEIFLPQDASPDALVLALPRISHMDRSPYDTRDLSDVGSSGSCEQDVACDPKWSTTNLAVAKEVFDAAGGTYICTGQLLSNTSGNGEPLFATANHCMSQQSETLSAAFFWFFQRASCAGGDPTSVTQTTGGADLLNTSDIEAGFDFTLMRLRNSPPGGVAMAGWTTSSVGSNDAIAGIHHPAGDVKMLSTGRVTGFDAWGRQSPSNSHIEVQWSEGVTEGGSSGSGLFLDGSWPNQPLVGVLSGGSSYCSAPTAPDLYGRFDRVFEQIEPWLDPRSIATIAPGQTISGNVGSGGWVVRRITVSGSLDVTLETTSGDADLYLQPELAPSHDLYECRSQAGGTSDDACSIDNTRGQTYYIGVLGYSASGYRLTVGGSGAEDPPTPPAAPTGVFASLTSDTTVELLWTDASDDEAGFRIDRQSDGGSWSQLDSVGAGTTQLRDAGLSAGTQYCYRVTAYNDAGASTASNVSCVTTSAGGGGDGGGGGEDPATVPSAPTGATAALLSNTSIEVTWADTSDNEDGFRVERQAAGSAWSEIASPGSGVGRWVDEGPGAGTEYCYRVRAYNGEGASDPSNVSCVTTPPADGGGDGGGGDGGDPTPTPPPDRPTRLELFRFRGEIDLVWDDNSEDEQGFNIYRKGGGGGWQRIASVPADDFYYFDTSVQRRTRYCYVVKAFNAAGESTRSNRRCIRAR